MTIWAAIHVGIDIPQQHAVHQDHLAGWMFCGFVRAVDLAMPRAEHVGAEAGTGDKPQGTLPYAEARDPVNLQ